jgi:hypothetical protein
MIDAWLERWHRQVREKNVSRWDAYEALHELDIVLDEEIGGKRIPHRREFVQASITDFSL